MMMTTPPPTPGQPLSEADVSLLPCPFCGSESVSQDSTACTDAADYIWFKCDGCGVESEGEHGRDAALAQWNRRPHVPSPASSSSVEQGDVSGERKAPIALGAQHSTTTDFPPDEVLACVGSDDAPVSRPAGEGEREAVARIVELAIVRHGIEEAALEGTLLDADAILALLSPAAPDAPGGGWRPIETAPKDGTVIHVWADGFEWPEAVRWEMYEAGDAEEAGEPGYWTYAEPLLADVTDDCGSEDWTHWMPLPAPPAIPAQPSEGGE